MAKKKETKKKEEIEELDDEVEEELEIDDEEENIQYSALTVEDRLVNLENKVNILLFLTVVITILSAILLFGMFSNDSSSNVSDTYSEDSNTYSTEAFKEISATDIASESKGKTIVVLIGRQGCSYCAAFAPIITSVSKEYGITIRYIDFSKIVNVAERRIIDQTAYETIYNLKGEGSWDGFGATALNGTPNTLIIKDNVIIGGINGYQSSDGIRSAFDNANL